MNIAGSYLEELTQTGAKFIGGTYGMDILKNRIDDVTEQGK